MLQIKNLQKSSIIADSITLKNFFDTIYYKWAQEKNAQTPTKRQRVSREQMAEMQAKHISRQLALDDAASQKFIETYCAYQKEVWALRPHRKGIRPNRSEMTDAEAEKAIKEQFDHSQKVLSLRQEYYKKYNIFLYWQNIPIDFS